MTMKMRFWTILPLILVLMALDARAQQEGSPDAATASDAAVVKVMSFNIRYGSANDGPNSWEFRREFLIDVIREFDPDLLGTQETLGFQAEYLREELPEWTYVGRSREADPERGEQCAVYFRSERFAKLAEGHFWLSPSPDQPGVKGWDAALPRIATWVRLWDRQAQRAIVVLNTHFDHVGREARTESARVIDDFVQHVYPPAPLIVMGDFNSAAEDSEAYRNLTSRGQLVDTFRVRWPDRGAEEGTFNSWRGRVDGPRIDWILVSPSWKVLDSAIDRTQRDGRYPSDHYPVVTRLEYGDTATVVP